MQSLRAAPMFDLRGRTSDIAPLSATTSAMALVTLRQDSGQAASSSVATTTPWVASFASASDALKQGILSLADTVVHFIGKAVYATVGIFEKVFAKEVHTDKLCVSENGGETCVTRGQLDNLLAGQTASAGASTGSQSAPPQSPPPAGTSSDSSATSTPDAATSTPPTDAPAPITDSGAATAAPPAETPVNPAPADTTPSSATDSTTP